MEKVETADDPGNLVSSGFHLSFQGGGTGIAASLGVPPDGASAGAAPTSIFFWFDEGGGPPPPTEIPSGMRVVELFKLVGPVHIDGEDWKHQQHPRERYQHDVWVLLLAPAG